MYIFIVNPIAGNGKAKRIFDRLSETPIYEKLPCSVHITKYEKNAEQIAAKIITSREQITCIVVIGGDGTFHEVVNALFETRIPLSFIPGGSGNDFARGVGIAEPPQK